MLILKQFQQSNLSYKTSLFSHNLRILSHAYANGINQQYIGSPKREKKIYLKFKYIYFVVQSRINKKLTQNLFPLTHEKIFVLIKYEASGHPCST